ncbi:S8 family peptidase [Larkinella bovis]|uniref:S8 family peptidase n=1 Tax=Larkinella bovis TaxID=683041 RepID=A0ABW0IEG0_9BACT
MENNNDNPKPDDSPRGNEIPIDDKKGRFNFNPKNLDKTTIAIPLLRLIEKENKNRLKKSKKDQLTTEKGIGVTSDSQSEQGYNVIIDLNLRFEGGRQKARERVEELIKTAIESIPQRGNSQINEALSRFNPQYIFAWLPGDIIQLITMLDNEAAGKDKSKKAIYQIWPDFKIEAFMNKSISTVKADAAHYSFSASGNNITWAVMDSGIDKSHRHFILHDNIHSNNSYHLDFTATAGNEDPFKDDFGHGTHVGGIIAGQVIADDKNPIITVTRMRDEKGDIAFIEESISTISGMAPQCKLVSIKVLDKAGAGQVSSLIAAISHIQEINGYGRDIKIHGVNMSLGYNFDPEWFACGQSPLCVEVNRLVKSGVVVVIAAGNTGYGNLQSKFRGSVAAGLSLSINDPGNAELAITVGSTHRDQPHTYGVSYFSSKGPTGDGRLKPDLLAPGEKIISCAAGAKRRVSGATQVFDYIEDSGTSMAAPHVSGVIAAFLSIRREYIGQPEAVKDLFLSTATDLKRDRFFQGHGLVDLMRAIQAV